MIVQTAPAALNGTDEGRDKIVSICPQRHCNYNVIKSLMTKPLAYGRGTHAISPPASDTAGNNCSRLFGGMTEVACFSSILLACLVMGIYDHPFLSRRAYNLAFEHVKASAYI